MVSADKAVHRKRVISVIGTRPEAIKMAPIIKTLEGHHAIIDSIVVSTGQHREMLDQVLRIFKITPSHNLNLMRQNQSLCELTNCMVEAMEQLLASIRPDLLIVQGDTSTTFAASLAAFYCRVPVAHVEAGLRSFDKGNPFPEEMNRRLTTTLADYHFAPTPLAMDNLLKEGVARDRIYVTGNTIVDALALMTGEGPPISESALGGLDGPGTRMILVTAHRRENWGTPLENICLALAHLVERYKDVVIVFPVHLNPNVRKTVYEFLSGIPQIHLVEPLDYVSFLGAMKRATLILTDSGGIQEEAPSLGKPVLVLRKTTERPEASQSGMARIIGTEVKDIIASVAELLDDAALRVRMSQGDNPYGDGLASSRIVSTLLGLLKVVLEPVESSKAGQPVQSSHHKTVSMR
jgi:UDP-N-acetylglucosamine 2-epimerase (non-hydrolysing)